MSSQCTLFTCPGCGKPTTKFDVNAAYCEKKNCPVISFEKSRLFGQRIVDRNKCDIFNANWRNSKQLDWWLKTYMSDGSSLNVCCGYSTIGDTRIDISADSTRTISGNLFTLLEDYGPDAFDYVLIDPNFAAYVSGENRFRWQQDALKVARKCLITKRPRVNSNLNSKKHYYSVVEETSPALSLLRFDFK